VIALGWVNWDETTQRRPLAGRAIGTHSHAEKSASFRLSWDALLGQTQQKNDCNVMKDHNWRLPT